MTFDHDTDLNVVTRVTDPVGNSVTYAYSDTNDLTGVSGGCAGCGGSASMSYTYTGGSEGHSGQSPISVPVRPGANPAQTGPRPRPQRDSARACQPPALKAGSDEIGDCPASAS